MKTNSFFVASALSLLFVSLLTGCGSRYVRNYSSDVNIYSEEDTNSSVVGVLPANTAMEIEAEQWNDWYEVEYQGSKAYISGGEVELIDADGEKVWMCKALFKGLGVTVLVILAIVIGLAIVGLVISGVMFLVGILMRIGMWALGFAGIAWILGFAITQDGESTFQFIAWGAGIGAVVGIVRLFMNPFGEAAEGMKAVNNSYKAHMQSEAEWIAQEKKLHEEGEAVKMEDGTQARRFLDGRIEDEHGNAYKDNGDGTATQIS